MPRLLLVVLILLNLAWAAPRAAAQPAAVDYNREIRPILSNNCYACHGPDEAKREAGLRLDKQDGALAALESGGAAIVPGNSAASKLIARITASDEAELMPPKDSGKKLSADEIAKLRR